MARRLGGQEPTFSTVGEWATTRGPEAVAMFEAYGRRYYASQKHEMDVFFARNADGSVASLTVGITKPRQNGKSFAARDYALWMAFVEHENVLYTAHRGGTVRKMFKEMCDFIEMNKDFKDEVDNIYKAGGYEGIYLADGTYIEFQTRTNSGARGGTYRVIVVDEAQELTSVQQDAMLPTASAAGEIDEGESDPQVIYIGTVPGPECNGTVFREMHDKVHNGESDTWWLEWGATGDSLEEVDIDDVDLWYACNPAMGRRMSERTVRNEHDTMSRDGFARERLGWWSPTAGLPDYVISASKWDALSTENPPADGKRAYGVRFSPDGSEAFLAAALLSDDGTVHTEMVRRESMSNGTSWLAEFIAERVNEASVCVIDGKSGVQGLVDRLGRMPKGYVHVCSAADATSAAATLADCVNEKTLTWYAPQADLRDSATTSIRRSIGNGGSWGFGGANPEPITAAALAVWGVKTARRDPRRKGLVG